MCLSAPQLLQCEGRNTNREIDVGLFDLFKSKENSNNMEALLIGYFRTETSKLLGHEVNSKKFDDACKSAGDAMHVLLIPLLNREIQQGVADTISSVCKTRFDEAFGEYMVLLFVRFSVIQKAILEGKVKAEEATPDLISKVLHGQIKKLISRV